MVNHYKYFEITLSDTVCQHFAHDCSSELKPTETSDAAKLAVMAAPSNTSAQICMGIGRCPLKRKLLANCAMVKIEWVRVIPPSIVIPYDGY